MELQLLLKSNIHFLVFRTWPRFSTHVRFFSSNALTGPIGAFGEAAAAAAGLREEGSGTESAWVENRVMLDVPVMLRKLKLAEQEYVVFSSTNFIGQIKFMLLPMNTTMKEADYHVLKLRQK